ncbi:DENN domain-containing protein 5B-like [Dysidea avara]|uniref:DENN domain-containing protein 5B-like n=1 Tax=Dysidea avara TaxID=196820 RepID=UPI0033334517
MTQLINYFAVVGLSSDDLKNHISDQDFLTKSYPPKVLSHFPNDKRFDDHAIRTLCLPDGLHVRQITFPEDEKPEFHSFVITREDGSRTYGCALSFYEINTDQKLVDAVKCQEQIAENALIVSESDEKLWKRGGSFCIQKCICLTSSYPHVSPLRQYLLQLYQATIGGLKLSMPIELFLANLCYDVPAPSPGCCVQFQGPLSKISCTMPGVYDLPLCDYSLLTLIQKIGITKLVRVFTCILLEHQLLIKSASYSELMECCECLTSLLCPFVWPHVYVPILPASQYGFLDAPVPYIMGLKASFDFNPDLDITNEGSLCMLDLNHGKLDVPEDLPAFPDSESLLGKLQEIAETHNLECIDLRGVSLSPTQTTHGHSGVINMLQSYFKGDMKSSSSEEIAKLVGIATRAGIKEEVSSPASSITSDTEKLSSQEIDHVVNSELFIKEMREVFLQQFVELFRDYEKFTIYPKQTFDQWKRDREQFQNFDRTAFLSDQPEKHLPFLSAFLETQMFRGFIDEKIEASFRQEPSRNLRLFDNRIELAITERSIRSPVFDKPPLGVDEPCSPALDTAPPMIDIPLPFISKPSENVSHRPKGVFPSLDLATLSRQRSSSPSLQERSGSLEKKQTRRSSGVIHEAGSSRQMIQRHAKFVMQLWRESRARVKNMVGSSPNAKSNVEENTQIVSLCDLLERIWSHGLIAKKDGKSPLWSHLMAYAETDTKHCEPVSSSSPPAQAARSTSPKKDKAARPFTPTHNFKAQLKRKSLQSPELRERVSALLCPPSCSLIDDILTIKMMTEIKTDVGRTRAFIRLALEKKVLYKHLVELLSNKTLRDQRYKDYAFLRTEDEKEQFLLHMLTLSAKDFSCFTRGFRDSTILYRVLIVGEGKRFGLSTACLYCNLAGEYNNSGVNWFTKGEYTADIKCQNLGPITCVRIGHDNSGLSPSTWVDSVFLQNITTGHTYRFPCNQWLSRAEGDCSTERFLVGKKLNYNPMVGPPSIDTVFSAAESGKRRGSKDIKETQAISSNDLCQKLTMSVQGLTAGENCNNIEQLNSLLGAEGFVQCLEQALLFGTNTNRKSKKPLVWDLVEKMSAKITCMHNEEKTAAEKLQLVVSKLQDLESGKVEKFHIFICVGLRDQFLSTWIELFANSSATVELYTPGSFFLDQSLREVMIKDLNKLLQLHIPLPSLLLGSL